MTEDHFYGGLMGLLYVTVVILIGYGMYQEPLPPPRKPPPTIEVLQPAADGPRCTSVYPRGFRITKRDRKVPTCTGAASDSWRDCTPRHHT